MYPCVNVNTTDATTGYGTVTCNVRKSWGPLSSYVHVKLPFGKTHDHRSRGPDATIVCGGRRQTQHSRTQPLPFYLGTYPTCIVYIRISCPRECIESRPLRNGYRAVATLHRQRGRAPRQPGPRCRVGKYRLELDAGLDAASSSPVLARSW